MTTIEQTDAETNWYSLSGADVVERLDTNREQGLAAAEVQRRLAQYGRNEIASEPPRRSGRRPRASSSTR